MQCLPSLIVLLFAVFCSYRTIRIESHITPDYNEGLLGLHSNAESFIDSTWILHVISEEPIIDAHLDAIKETIAKDECILLYSGIGTKDLLFKVYCHKEVDPEREKEEITIETVLYQTLNQYMYRYFKPEQVHTERNKLVRRPHFFYGNEHTLDYAIRLDANKGKDPLNRDSIDNIMMPSNEALNHIKELDFIQVNTGWDIDRIDQHAGMLDQRYRYITNASNVNIFVIDTGIRVSHTEFEDRATFLINTVGDGIDTDMAGHGTFCASEVAGKRFGVAKKAHLYGVKVLDSLGDGDLFTIQAGIIQVIETANLDPTRRSVASLSLGGTSSPLLDKAVASLTANNIVVAVSAGNSGADACLYSPAVLGGYPSANVLTVGATDINDFRPSWSNYGSCVSISAPGASITAAWPTSDTATNTLSGTSMSAPLVAGVCALVLQQNKDLTVAEVKSIVLQWATPNIIDYASITGGGRNLLYSLIDLSIVPPIPVASPPVLLIEIPDTSSGHKTSYSLLFIFCTVLLSLY